METIQANAHTSTVDPIVIAQKKKYIAKLEAALAVIKTEQAARTRAAARPPLAKLRQQLDDETRLQKNKGAIERLLEMAKAALTVIETPPSPPRPPAKKYLPIVSRFGVDTDGNPETTVETARPSANPFRWELKTCHHPWQPLGEPGQVEIRPGPTDNGSVRLVAPDGTTSNVIGIDKTLKQHANKIRKQTHRFANEDPIFASKCAVVADRIRSFLAGQFLPGRFELTGRSLSTRIFEDRVLQLPQLLRRTTDEVIALCNASPTDDDYCQMVEFVEPTIRLDPDGMRRKMRYVKSGQSLVLKLSDEAGRAAARAAAAEEAAERRQQQARERQRRKEANKARRQRAEEANKARRQRAANQRRLDASRKYAAQQEQQRRRASEEKKQGDVIPSSEDSDGFSESESSDDDADAQRRRDASAANRLLRSQPPERMTDAERRARDAGLDPDIWLVYTDEDTGKPFYFARESGQTTWDKPKSKQETRTAESKQETRADEYKEDMAQYDAAVAALSENQLDFLEEVFDAYDQNDDAKLNELELTRQMVAAGRRPRRGEAKERIDTYDFDGDGKLNFREFVIWYATTNASAQDEWSNAEKKFDKNQEALRQSSMETSGTDDSDDAFEEANSPPAAPAAAAASPPVPPERFQGAAPTPVQETSLETWIRLDTNADGQLDRDTFNKALLAQKREILPPGNRNIFFQEDLEDILGNTVKPEDITNIASSAAAAAATDNDSSDAATDNDSSDEEARVVPDTPATGSEDDDSAAGRTEADPDLAILDGNPNLKQLREINKRRNLGIKTSGPGRKTEAVLKDIRAALKRAPAQQNGGGGAPLRRSPLRRSKRLQGKTADELAAAIERRRKPPSRELDESAAVALSGAQPNWEYSTEDEAVEDESLTIRDQASDMEFAESSAVETDSDVEEPVMTLASVPEASVPSSEMEFAESSTAPSSEMEFAESSAVSAPSSELDFAESSAASAPSSELDFAESSAASAPSSELDFAESSAVDTDSEMEFAASSTAVSTSGMDFAESSAVDTDSAREDVSEK